MYGELQPWYKEKHAYALKTTCVIFLSRIAEPPIRSSFSELEDTPY